MSTSARKLIAQVRAAQAQPREPAELTCRHGSWDEHRSPCGQCYVRCAHPENVVRGITVRRRARLCAQSLCRLWQDRPGGPEPAPRKAQAS